VNRWAELVGVGDNLCLPGRGVAYLDSRELHGSLDFGNYSEL